MERRERGKERKGEMDKDRETEIEMIKLNKKINRGK